MDRCAVDDCPDPRKSRQLCKKHYTRWWRTGDPLGTLPRPPKIAVSDEELLAQFQKRIAKRANGCWEWDGRRDRNGYGVMSIPNHHYLPKHCRLAHRISWYLHHGTLPDDALVLHDCDNPPCVNPEHLHLGSQLDNMQECVQRDRHGGGMPPGERSINAKLTADQVLEIRGLDGVLPQRRIAQMFGVSQTTVGQIIRRETWRCVA